jgi:hypothetical protein
MTVSFLYFFNFIFYTGLSYGWRDLSCPAMQSMPENCLSSMSAAYISERLISRRAFKQVWRDWQLQIPLQWPHTPVQPNVD